MTHIPPDFEFSAFKPDKVLQRYFSQYNKKYFSGKLGHVQVGWNVRLRETPCVGISVTTVDDTVDSITHTIQLDPALREYGAIVRLTLLHEMAHLHLFPYRYHGKKFDAEMLRLAAHGAFSGLW